MSDRTRRKGPIVDDGDSVWSRIQAKRARLAQGDERPTDWFSLERLRTIAERAMIDEGVKAPEQPVTVFDGLTFDELSHRSPAPVRQGAYTLKVERATENPTCLKLYNSMTSETVTRVPCLPAEEDTNPAVRIRNRMSPPPRRR